MLLKNCIIDGFVQHILLNKEYIGSVAPKMTDAENVIDMGMKIVIPGMIDLHTHIRDLEQSYKEDWLSGSSSAIAGGVTTIFDMPNTIPPTTSLHNLHIKQQAAEKSKVNYGLYAGATPSNIIDVREMLETHQAAGIKIFLSASSSNEVVEDRKTLVEFFKLAKEYDVPVLTHCELQSCIAEREHQYIDDKYNSIHYHNVIRDRECAYKALQLVLELASQVKNRLHVLHISTAEEIDLIKQYKRNDDFGLTCEVTPHHLFLNDSVLESAGNFGKVNPPIRNKKDNDVLFEALLDGTVDTVGSDHAPHSIEEKRRQFRKAPSGFPGLETTLPLLFSRHLSLKDLSLFKIIQLTSTNAASIMKIKNRGKIAPGYYADFTVIDPDITYTISADQFATKAKYTPFEGVTVRGKIVKTFVNGKEIEQKGMPVEYD
jgi:dihydroorotase